MVDHARVFIRQPDGLEIPAQAVTRLLPRAQWLRRPK
jgi:hypothetical protein